LKFIYDRNSDKNDTDEFETNFSEDSYEEYIGEEPPKEQNSTKKPKIIKYSDLGSEKP
jgi:hypothetical protein